MPALCGKINLACQLDGIGTHLGDKHVKKLLD